MKQLFSDNQMLDKCKFWALAYLGTRDPECKTLMNYWGAMRRQCGYAGGRVEDPTATHAAEILSKLEASQ